MSLTASLSAASGHAPHQVFFDASESTDPSTSRPFHDLLYIWYFDDDGEWQDTGAGSRSKASMAGPVAAHVYESAGTYNPRVYIFNGTTARFITHADLGTVTVTDADTFYSGTNTVCISNDTDHVGAPAGATTVDTTSDLDAAWTTHRGANKRILLRAGDSFDLSTNITVAHAKMTLGKYGAGADPIVTGPDGSFIEIDADDFKIIDIELDGESQEASIGLWAAGAFNRALVLRVTGHDLHAGLLFSTGVLSAPPVWDEVFVVESDFTTLVGGGGGYGMFVSGLRLAILGCTVDDTTLAEHGIRIPYADRFVVAHNILSDPASDKHVLTVRAPDWAGSTPVAAESYTQKGVVHSNKFVGGANPWTVTVGPFDNTTDVRLKDVLVERNWFVAGAGTQRGLRVEASDVTVRNNLIDMTGAASHGGVLVARTNTAMPTPNNVYILNNSVYSADTDNDFAGVVFQTDDVDLGTIVVRNNLAYAPNDSNHQMIANSAAVDDLQAANNSSDAQVQSTCPFTDTTPTNPADFMPAGYALSGADSTVKNYLDFFGNYRGSTLEMGAAEVGTEELPDEDSSDGLSDEAEHGRKRKRYLLPNDTLVWATPNEIQEILEQFVKVEKPKVKKKAIHKAKKQHEPFVPIHIDFVPLQDVSVETFKPVLKRPMAWRDINKIQDFVKRRQDDEDAILLLL